jgi:hypothetical protein
MLDISNYYVFISDVKYYEHDVYQYTLTSSTDISTHDKISKLRVVGCVLVPILIERE